MFIIYISNKMSIQHHKVGTHHAKYPNQTCNASGKPGEVYK